MYNVKKTLANTMLTTGASLSILAVYLFFNGENDFSVTGIFQIIAANTVINFGILLRSKFEIKNVILDFITDVGYIIIVLLIFGMVFDWFALVPVWLLVAMAVVIYSFVIITTVVKIKNDTKEINDLLQKRKKP
jgi:hypothetical protein